MVLSSARGLETGYRDHCRVKRRPGAPEIDELEHLSKATWGASSASGSWRVGLCGRRVIVVCIRRRTSGASDFEQATAHPDALRNVMLAPHSVEKIVRCSARLIGAIVASDASHAARLIAGKRFRSPRLRSRKVCVQSHIATQSTASPRISCVCCTVRTPSHNHEIQASQLRPSC
jgi:hypothetical protein